MSFAFYLFLDDDVFFPSESPCFVQIVIDEKDQLMLVEFVTFIDSKGGKINLCHLKKFFRKNSDWKRRLKRGDDEVKCFCDNSNGELIWGIDRKGEGTVSTKCCQFGRNQPSSCSTASVPSKVNISLISRQFSLLLL